MLLAATDELCRNDSLRVMKDPLLPHILFHPRYHLMVFAPRGIITADAMNQSIDVLEEIEDRTSSPFHRFTDLSKLDAVDIDFHDLFRLSLHRRLSYSARPSVKSAFYVTSSATARIVKVHALLTKQSPLRVRMFEDIGATAKWLRCPVEILKQDTD